MIEKGDTLTVKNDLISIDNTIDLEAEQVVFVRDLMTVDGFWSGDYWIPEKVIGVMLVDNYGVYPPDCFIEEF